MLKISICKLMLERTFEETRVKDKTGLLHISDRLFIAELSRVEAARGTLYSSPNNIFETIPIVTHANLSQTLKDVAREFSLCYNL